MFYCHYITDHFSSAAPGQVSSPWTPASDLLPLAPAPSPASAPASALVPAPFSSLYLPDCHSLGGERVGEKEVKQWESSDAAVPGVLMCCREVGCEEERKGGERGRQRGETHCQLVMASSCSAWQTGADRPSVFLLRCVELLTRSREEKTITLHTLLWMN